MSFPPKRCPHCDEPNPTGLSYCAMCGKRFIRGGTEKIRSGPGKKELRKREKLKKKREKKKRELIILLRKKKITPSQYRKGMRKLGYHSDADKAEALKKFIHEQIKEFQNMDLRETGDGYYPDPYESGAELPRDESGRIITDFTASGSNPSESENGPRVVEFTNRSQGNGPLFGESLFPGSGDNETRAEPPRHIVTESPEPASGPRRRTARKREDWMEQEEFEIDLEEEPWWEDDEDEWWELENEGEDGWWDDDEWELELDEEDWEDWEDEDEWDDTDGDEVVFDEDDPEALSTDGEFVIDEGEMEFFEEDVEVTGFEEYVETDSESGGRGPLDPAGTCPSKISSVDDEKRFEVSGRRRRRRR